MNAWVEDENRSKILVIDSSGKLKKFLTSNLTDKFDIIRVETFESALKKLSERTCDLIVHNKDDIAKDYEEFLELKKREYSEIPFLLYIEERDEEVIKEAKKREVSDLIFPDEGSLIQNRIDLLLESGHISNSSEKLLQRMDEGFVVFDSDSVISYINEKGCKLMKKSREEILGSDFWELFPEARESKFEFKYRTSTEDQEPVHYEAFYHPLETWFEVRAYPSGSKLFIFFNDVTDKKQRKKEVESQKEQQEILNDLLRKAIEEEDVVELQQDAVERVAKTLGADYANILSLEGKEKHLVLAATYGMDTYDIGRVIVPANTQHQSFNTLYTTSPTIVEDFDHSRFKRTEHMEVLDIRSGISVFIGQYDCPWGTFCVYSRKKIKFSDQDVRFLEAVADVITLALEKQQLLASRA